MPDLGRYAMAVLAAYGATIVLIGGLVGLSLWRSARIRRQLEAVERRMPR
ncbi:heme exporter protein CcmD [Falsirhodobacter algicola]